MFAFLWLFKCFPNLFAPEMHSLQLFRQHCRLQNVSSAEIINEDFTPALIMWVSLTCFLFDMLCIHLAVFWLVQDFTLALIMWFSLTYFLFVMLCIRLAVFWLVLPLALASLWCTLHVRKAGSFTEAGERTGLPSNRHLPVTVV